MNSSSSAYDTASVDAGRSHAELREQILAAISSEIDNGAASGTLVAVLLVDIRHFHEVNTRFDYRSGDKVLLKIQDLFTTQLKKARIVERLGGNTFCLLVPELKSAALLELAANKIRSVLANSVQLNGNGVPLSCHLGMAIYPDSEMTAEKLLQQAEVSLRYAKSSLSGTVHIPRLKGEENVSVSELESQLDKAIEKQELEFFYQPKINLDTGRADSAEALVRWNSPSLGFMPPDKFIPVAEQSSLIRKLTDWGIKTACREKVAFQEVSPDFSLSINLSARDLYDEDLVHVIDTAREIWSINPESLVFEITEGVILENQAVASAQLKKLKDRGIRISLDDFGTGYSSLSYFKKIPADELKIDKSFVFSLFESADDVSIVELIISLAKKFGLSVVAEGIEDEKTLAKLVSMGCNYAQGYYFSRPLPLIDCVEWIKAHNSP